VTGIAGEQKGRRSHARRNHELLVDAARVVFAERGVEAPLEEIARRAGLGIGTLYRHFATRDTLIEAMVESRIGDVLAVAEAAGAETDGWEAFVGFLDRTLELQAGDRLLKEILSRYPPPAGRVASARTEMRALFERVLARAHAQGTLRPDFALPDLALLFWSFAPILDATAEVAPTAWRRHLHWLLDGLRASAATPQAEPPLADADLQQAMQALHAHRPTRRPPAARIDRSDPTEATP
jgi:AcrR family transcriptional regulator